MERLRIGRLLFLLAHDLKSHILYYLIYVYTYIYKSYLAFLWASHQGELMEINTFENDRIFVRIEVIECFVWGRGGLLALYRSVIQS
jgi:hypothetical protein